MAKHGGLSQFLSAVTKQKAAEKQETEQQLGGIREIDIDDLVPNDNNMYGLRDIDLLASMIELNNYHLETLEVEEIPQEAGKYRIIAGHRRQAAWRKLLDNHSTEKRTLPCIVRRFDDVSLTLEDENGGEEECCFSSEQMSLVSLILSNLGQRKEKTLEERVWEIEQLEPYAKALYRFKKSNNEYKGSFRDFFAKEILEISPAKLQRQSSLSNLSENAKKAVYEDKSISETAAVKLATLPEENQNEFVRSLQEGEINGTVSDVENMKQELASKAGEQKTNELAEENQNEFVHSLQEDELSGTVSDVENTMQEPAGKAGEQKTDKLAAEAEDYADQTEDEEYEEADECDDCSLIEPRESDGIKEDSTAAEEKNVKSDNTAQEAKNRKWVEESVCSILTDMLDDCSRNRQQAQETGELAEADNWTTRENLLRDLLGKIFSE